MSESELQFRSVTFGGFHKQDVLDYIEKSSQEHNGKLEALKKELEECGAARAALERECAAAKAEGERLSAELSASRADVARGEEELARGAEQLDALNEQLSRAREELLKLAPAAEAYETIKDRTAGMELEAHQRAQGVMNAAEEQVKKTRAEVERWLCKVQAGYDRLRTDMDATISHAGGELERVRVALERISEEFTDGDTALEALNAACRDNLGPRAPEPLPLDEA